MTTMPTCDQRMAVSKTTTDIVIDKNNTKSNNNNNNNNNSNINDAAVERRIAIIPVPPGTELQDGQVQERRYGCYRLGIIVAILIIVVLVIGTVPVFYSIENEKVVLIVTIITLVIVGILLLVYCFWQRRRATTMRNEVCQRELEYLDHAAS